MKGPADTEGRAWGVALPNVSFRWLSGGKFCAELPRLTLRVGFRVGGRDRKITSEWREQLREEVRTSALPAEVKRRVLDDMRGPLTLLLWPLHLYFDPFDPVLREVPTTSLKQ